MTYSARETESVGLKFSKNLRKGDCVALIGGLGSGKTCFTKGIARGLGIRGGTSSPTFKIISEYDIKLKRLHKIKFYHIDFYRINDYNEFLNLGLDEILYSDGIVVMEWADKFIKNLPKEFFKVRLSIIGDNNRRINIKY